MILLDSSILNFGAYRFGAGSHNWSTIDQLSRSKAIIEIVESARAVLNTQIIKEIHDFYHKK